MLGYIKFRPDFEKALGLLLKELSSLYDVIYKQIDKIRTFKRDVAIKTM